MSLNTEYVAKMLARLKQWDAELDALAERGDKESAEARATISDLKASRDAARTSIDKIRFAGESAGAQLHSGMESAWEAMRKALENASSTLRR